MLRKRSNEIFDILLVVEYNIIIFFNECKESIMKICKNCGKELDDQCAFCFYCGTKLAVTCAKCGAELNAECRFCFKCGAPVDGDTAAENQETDVTESKGDQLFDFSAMEAGFDGQLADRAEYEKKMKKARALAISKRFDEAREIYENTVEEDPTDMNGYIGLIRVVSKNFTVLDGEEIEERIRIAKEISGVDDLSCFDREYAAYEEKRKAEKERKAAEAEAAERAQEEKKKFLEKARVEDNVLKGYYGDEETVVIPAFIDAIDEYAFNNLNFLETLKLSKSIRYIPYSAIYKCYNLRSIEVDKKNEFLKSIDGNLYSKDGMTLYRYAPGKIADSFEISADVKRNVASDAFKDCKNLTSITVDKNNKTFQSIDGVLYSKDGKKLIRFPENKKDTSFVVPNGVETIGVGAFYGCENLENITISDSVRSIGASAFEGCKKLSGIIFTNKNGWKGINYQLDKKEIVMDKFKIENVSSIAYYFTQGMYAWYHWSR